MKLGFQIFHFGCPFHQWHSYGFWFDTALCWICIVWLVSCHILTLIVSSFLLGSQDFLGRNSESGNLVYELYQSIERWFTYLLIFCFFCLWVLWLLEKKWDNVQEFTHPERCLLFASSSIFLNFVFNKWTTSSYHMLLKVCQMWTRDWKRTKDWEFFYCTNVVQIN